MCTQPYYSSVMAEFIHNDGMFERDRKLRQTNNSTVVVCVEAIKQEWKQSRYLLKWNEAIFGSWSQKVKEKTAPQACYLIWMTLWRDITQSVFSIPLPSLSFMKPTSGLFSSFILLLFFTHFLSVGLSFYFRGKPTTSLKEKCDRVCFCTCVWTARLKPAHL